MSTVAGGDDERRRRIAIHEAGHAVVAYLVGADVSTVTIVPTEERLGHIAHGWWVDATERTYATQAEHREAVERQVRDSIAICLAGRAAVELLVGRV